MDQCPVLYCVMKTKIFRELNARLYNLCQARPILTWILLAKTQQGCRLPDIWLAEIYVNTGHWPTFSKNFTGVSKLSVTLHRVEISWFFCHSDFKWNQFWEFLKCKICHFNTFRGSEFWVYGYLHFLKAEIHQITKFRAQKKA